MAGQNKRWYNGPRARLPRAYPRQDCSSLFIVPPGGLKDQARRVSPSLGPDPPEAPRSREIP